MNSATNCLCLSLLMELAPHRSSRLVRSKLQMLELLCLLTNGQADSNNALFALISPFDEATLLRLIAASVPLPLLPPLMSAISFKPTRVFSP
jgi:hypothetical protein